MMMASLSLWVLFPLPFIVAADEIRFLATFLRELSLGPLMTFSRFDQTVEMALSTVPGVVTCDRTSGR